MMLNILHKDLQGHQSTKPAIKEQILKHSASCDKSSSCFSFFRLSLISVPQLICQAFICYSFSVTLDVGLILCRRKGRELFKFHDPFRKEKVKSVCLQGGTKISHLKSLKAAKVGEINITMLSLFAEKVYCIQYVHFQLLINTKSRKRAQKELITQSNLFTVKSENKRDLFISNSSHSLKEDI